MREQIVPKQEFQTKVLQWYVQHHRNFPWRNTKDPFYIIVAEVCLQKTGAKKAEPAYQAIIKKFSTVALLAQAEPTQLLPIFKPIGLVTRAELLIKIAQQIDKEFSGRVPKSFKELKKIKGVGQYIANAVLVFAYDENVPLLDEGIARVYRRVFGMERLKRAYADKELWAFAKSMLPHNSVKEYSWGLLDMSALLCKPRRPNCTICPLKTVCLFVKQSQL